MRQAKGDLWALELEDVSEHTRNRPNSLEEQEEEGSGTREQPPEF